LSWTARRSSRAPSASSAAPRTSPRPDRRPDRRGGARRARAPQGACRDGARRAVTWPVRILADDLTGALDAAAPFATEARPVRLPWRGRARWGRGRRRRAPKVGTWGGTRPRPPCVRPTPGSRGGRARPRPGSRRWTAWLRGHPVAETAEMIRAGGFRRCVFAPAFPEMGRVTRGGRQFAPYGAGAPRPVGPDDLRAAFVAEGLDARLGAEPEARPAQVVLVDAETPEDLARGGALGRPRRALGGQPGAGGGARGGLPAASPTSRGRRGRGHRSSRGPRAQVERVQGRLARPSGPVTLTAAGRRCSIPSRRPPTPAPRARRWRRCWRRPSPRPRGGGVPRGGGRGHARRGAGRLRGGAWTALGEVEPGVPPEPAARRPVLRCGTVTKSGGFGGPDLLSRLVRSEAEPGGMSRPRDRRRHAPMQRPAIFASCGDPRMWPHRPPYG
jgi:hypothetical protein